MYRLFRTVAFLVAAVLSAAVGYLAVQGWLRVKEGRAPLPGVSVTAAATPAPGVTTVPAAAATPAPLPADPELAAMVRDSRRAAAASAGGPTTATEAVPGVPGSPRATPQPGGARPLRTPEPSAVIREWPSGQKLIALTYDDGPNATWTPRLVEMLLRKNVKATFFLIGKNVDQRPEVAKMLVENGFELGNHTVNHKLLKQLTPEQIRFELSSTNESIQRAAGVTPRLMRPPYGNAPRKAIDICLELGLRIIHWNVDTNDWKRGVTADAMKANIMKNARDGAIVLMHDKSELQVTVSEAVIDDLRRQGYEFVSVGELLGTVPRVPLDKSRPAPVVTTAAAVPIPAAGNSTTTSTTTATAAVAPPAPAPVIPSPASPDTASTSSPIADSPPPALPDIDPSRRTVIQPAAPASARAR